MELREFTDCLYEQLTKKIDELALQDDPKERYEKIVSEVQLHLQQLRDFIREYTFTNSQEEIRFFKEIKPRFTSLLIYYMGLFNIETEKPASFEKALREYYGQQLEILQKQFTENFIFHKYYRSGATHLDEKYFLRDTFDIHLSEAAFLVDYDKSFSTLCDYKVAKIIASEMLVSYIEQAVSDIEQGTNYVPKPSIITRFNIAWTASKTDFIELLYGLHCIGAFNNGNVELSKVMGAFAASFGVDFGNYSRYLQQMRIRKKNRTSFIDKMRDKLTGYMDELDDQL